MIDTSVKNIYSVVDVKKKVPFNHKQILSCKALKFLADLHLNFNYRRMELLSFRNERKSVPKNGSPNLSDLIIFSGKKIKVFGLDKNTSIKKFSFEEDDVIVVDFNSFYDYSWTNLVETQIALKKVTNAEEDNIQMDSDSSTEIAVTTNPICVLGRDIFVDEPNFLVDKNPISAAFFDFGLFFFHNAKKLLSNGSAPFVYIHNIENYFEAKFWNEFLAFTEQELELETGSIKAVVSLNPSLPGFEKRHIAEEFSEHLIF